MSPLSRSIPERRRLIEHAYAHAVSTMEPETAVRRALIPNDHGFAVNGEQVDVNGRLIVLAIGKAATPMARAVTQVLGSRIDAGVVLTKDGHLGDVPVGFQAFEAAHPVPDDRGILATREILRVVAGLSGGDVVLAMISGGGSALLESPRGGLDLTDIQHVTDLLLRAGAPIQDLNAVRSELSEVKGGGLREAIGRAKTVSFVLSDVLGNAREVIASGPTIARTPNPQRAMDIIASYRLTDRVPSNVTRVLAGSVAHPAPATRSDTDRDLFAIIGDNATFVDAFGAYLEALGLSVCHLWTDQEGEATDRAVAWTTEARSVDADAVIGGGELTVTVRGDGLGGRNTEFALAAASELAEIGERMTIASLASDGQDGSANAAGAIVDETSAAALKQRGFDIDRVLESNDSATALEDIGALVSPGPTGTNVNDVYVAIRG